MKVKAKIKESPQKFQRGDVVLVGALPPSMSHFTYEHQFAVVVGSYADQYGGIDRTNYTLFGPQGTSSWYPEDLLTPVCI